MRMVIILLAALFLAACQQAGGNAPALAKDPNKPESLRFFEPELVALQNQLVVNLAEACQAQANAGQQFDRCLRERVSAAFDDSGEGSKNCAFHTAFLEFLDCVALGNTLIDVMRRITDTTPLPAGFWSDGDTMFKTLSRSIIKRGVANCEQADSKALGTCIDRWFEDRMQLTATLTARCPSDAPGDRNACLFEAVMIRFMQDHVPRLSAIGV